MKSVEAVVEVMRARGMRVTPQRVGILRHLVANAQHPTVDALFDAARADMPTLSLKTVYQTVHDLEAVGAVRLLDLGTGQVRVDPNTEATHHHLVCSECGMVRDVPVEFPDVALPRRYRQAFTPTSVDVIFRGRCDACISAPDQTAAAR